MDANNVVVVRGTITSEPLVRELPSGSSVTQIEMTARTDARAVSVPVAVHDTAVDVGQGDEIVVTGHVSRRFFRAGGVTQSRTEVIAHRVVKATRKRTVDKAVAEAAALLG